VQRHCLTPFKTRVEKSKRTFRNLFVFLIIGLAPLLAEFVDSIEPDLSMIRAMDVATKLTDEIFTSGTKTTSMRPSASKFCDCSVLILF
jgi:hypothetical protein